MNSRIKSAMLVVSLLAPLAAQSQVSVSINLAPPPLPVYVQPAVPGEGYLWTPGYWAWNNVDGGYYWVPGAWVLAPRPGYLWTPGYWSFAAGGYRWIPGYWGLSVGFYGGVDYGFGYPGQGYVGGRWDRGAFYYNSAVNNVSTTRVRNVYRTTVVNQTVNVTRVSYNGGAGGVQARPTAVESRAQREPHLEATPAQVKQERMALKMPTQKAAADRAAPRVAATPKAGALGSPDAIKAADSAPAPSRQAPAAKAAHQPAPVPAERVMPGGNKAPVQENAVHKSGPERAPSADKRGEPVAAEPHGKGNAPTSSGAEPAGPHKAEPGSQGKGHGQPDSAQARAPGRKTDD